MKNLLPISFIAFISLFLAFSAVAPQANANGMSLDSKQNPIATLNYDPSGSSAWYPYYINDDKTPGILPEVLETILALANIEGVRKTFPPKRTNVAIKRGDIDFDFVNLDWLPKNESLEPFVFTDGIIRIKEYLVSLKGYQPPESIIEMNQLGTVRGYYYHDEDEFERVDFTSERELVLALKLNRIGQVIIGDRPALYWAQHLNVPIQFNELHSDGDLRIRLRKEHQHLIPHLNHAIKQINSSGKLEEIVGRYIDDQTVNIVIL